MCALTRIQGKFFGGGEWVQIREENGFWVLRTSKGAAADFRRRERPLLRPPPVAREAPELALEVAAADSVSSPRIAGDLPFRASRCSFSLAESAGGIVILPCRTLGSCECWRARATPRWSL